MAKTKVAALQVGALPTGKKATLDLVLGFEEKIIESGASVVVMPEALLGGLPEGRDLRHAPRLSASGGA